ncbi:MAG: metallopeptidase TldD-related protein [Myxococcota bacterium]
MTTSTPLPEAEKTLRLERAQLSDRRGPDPLLDLLCQEVQRNAEALASREDASAHHLAYEVTDVTQVEVMALHGALIASSAQRRRLLDVDVRVGTPALDNTHPRMSARYYEGVATLPLGDDAPLAIRNALWWETDQAYKHASAELIQVRAERNVGVERDAQVADFTAEKATGYVGEPGRIEVDRAVWDERVRAYSAMFRGHPHVHSSFVRLEVNASTRYFASSAGDRVRTGRTHARLSFGASSTVSDGSELTRTAELDAHELEGLPDEAVIRASITKVIDELSALVQAPAAEPYVGPAILDGKAAAVFFHEIFGHRVEGHRQRGDQEGQTFIDQVGRPVMHAVFDVYDDPTVRSVNGIDLNGYFLVDSEGVGARRAMLIDDGVFLGFLMSRMPIRGAASSNGHGRREPGYRPVERQANLFVDPSRVTSRRALEAALLGEVRRQNKPYGLRIGEVTGGYTMTQRGDPQAFKVEPVMVYRVYPDGRQQLVRGVSLEGTPLSVLGQVMAAANDFAVFNGYCGAESGEVPASAISPSLLLRQVELTREETAGQRPPLLPPPTRSAGDAPEGGNP